MAILGNGAVAMWCDIDPARRGEFEDWHAHEHFPERLSIPGFLRGTRWRSRSGDASIFVMYELAELDVFASAPYLARLNAPTPWSVKMMPAVANMVRSPCRVAARAGAGVGCGLVTLRLSPVSGQSARLRAWLQGMVEGLAKRAGLVAASLLETDAPVRLGQTAEERMRGGDSVADWALLLSGHDPDVLDGILRVDLAENELVAHGASPGIVVGRYCLAHVLTPQDLAAHAALQ